nr:immunoglobulin light chain junction region [Macaca mulatta]MOX26082.1 immunoglobulin light chain junction region [Macaca mulatta]
CQQYNCFPLTF